MTLLTMVTTRIKVNLNTLMFFRIAYKPGFAHLNISLFGNTIDHMSYNNKTTSNISFILVVFPGQYASLSHGHIGIYDVIR